MNKLSIDDTVTIVSCSAATINILGRDTVIVQ